MSELLIYFFSSICFLLAYIYMADSVIPKQQESLNRFNNEFTKTLNELKEKRKKLIKKVKRDQIKVQTLQAQMESIQKEKTTLEASLEKKEKILNKMNTTINNTHSAYTRIIETSHVLLTVLKKDKRKMKE